VTLGAESRRSLQFDSRRDQPPPGAPGLQVDSLARTKIHHEQIAPASALMSGDAIHQPLETAPLVLTGDYGVPCKRNRYRASCADAPALPHEASHTDYAAAHPGLDDQGILAIRVAPVFPDQKVHDGCSILLSQQARRQIEQVLEIVLVAQPDFEIAVHLGNLKPLIHK